MIGNNITFIINFWYFIKGMPILNSEDESVKSSFEIVFLLDTIKNKPSISWISYKLVLKSGEKEIIYEKKENDGGVGDYVLALKPINEIEKLITETRTFLSDKNKILYSFEPLEPSFELILEKGYKGYSVSCWVDAGNVISDHYSWDGFGLRFFTNEEKIKLFLNNMETECLKEKT